MKRKKFTLKQLKLKKAMGDFFASSPYLTKKQKKNEIDKLFR